MTYLDLNFYGSLSTEERMLNTKTPNTATQRVT